jgi:hypothetical protein
MPFHKEKMTPFGPGDLVILNEAFDLAWQRLLANGLEGNSKQLDESRKRLAKCILAFAIAGHVDRGELAARGGALFNGKLSESRAGSVTRK